MATLRFMIIGDLIGNPGIAMFQKWAPQLREKHKVDAVIVNGENSEKQGRGINSKIVGILKESGADVITTGNHAYDQKDIYNTFNERSDFLRPLNYPSACPGKGYTVFEVNGHTVAVVNLHGRVFIPDNLSCPFQAIDSTLSFLSTRTSTIIVDFHAEATSEKNAMGLFLDGRVSCVVGTHTHIPTADTQIFPKGTAYQTDLGAAGALHSVIGFEYDQVIKRMMVHHRFGKFKVDHKTPYVMNGVLLDVDTTTGKAISFERLRVIDEDLVVLAPKKNG